MVLWILGLGCTWVWFFWGFFCHFWHSKAIGEQPVCSNFGLTRPCVWIISELANGWPCFPTVLRYINWFNEGMPGLSALLGDVFHYTFPFGWCFFRTGISLKHGNILLVLFRNFIWQAWTLFYSAASRDMLAGTLLNHLCKTVVIVVSGGIVFIFCCSSSVKRF